MTLAIDDNGARGESRDARALRLVDRELEQLRGECDQLDAMLTYLQRRRDELESRFEQRLAQRDRLEAELWDRATGALSRELWTEEAWDTPDADHGPWAVQAYDDEVFEIEAVSDSVSIEIEIEVVEASLSEEIELLAKPSSRSERVGGASMAGEIEVPPARRAPRVVPPDLSRGRGRPTTPSASELLAAWGLQPTPPDLSDREVPPPALLGPQLESWELEDDDTVAPEPRFVPIAETLRILVVPGGRRARTRPRDAAPRSAPLVDTAPILLASRRLPRAGRGLQAG